MPSALPSKLGPALAVGFGGYERQVDLAVADGSPFVAMAGIGLDAAVVRSTPRLLKDHLGWVGYGVGALAHLGSSTKEMTVRLDGGELLVRRAQSVVVGNVGILPGGFALLPGASLDDGLLDVGILTPKGRPWLGLGSPVGRSRQTPPRAPVRALHRTPRGGEHGDRAPPRDGRRRHRTGPFVGGERLAPGVVGTRPEAPGLASVG